jgi:hypothetical protein
MDLARNAISLAAQPPLSYPCSDKLPFNLRTWPGLRTANIGLNATLVAGTLQLSNSVPINAQIRDSRKALLGQENNHLLRFQRSLLFLTVNNPFDNLNLAGAGALMKSLEAKYCFAHVIGSTIWFYCSANEAITGFLQASPWKAPDNRCSSMRKT